MANIPCTNRIVCPGPTPGLDADDPIINFSSEAVDGINFSEMSWPITDFTNPFTPDDPNNPPDTCDSPISQEEAELCAIRKAFIDQATSNGRFANLFTSKEQTCAFQCPDGSSFFWTVPPGAFVDFSQSAADQRSKDYACRQASLNAVCIAVQSTSACLHAAFLSVLSVTGGSGSYAVKLIAGTLPPGIGFVQDTETTAFFSGVPTATGSYPVLISARDTKGNVITRTVTIAVLAISNAASIPQPVVGTFYNFQLAGIGGTGPYTFSGGAGLPGGLVLQSDGFIVGNPVAPIGTGFSATVTDARGNSCTFNLTYIACSFGSIVWNNPPNSFTTPSVPNAFTFAITYPTPHSVRLVGTATMVAVDFALTYTNSNSNSFINLPAGPDRQCTLTITVRNSTGQNVYQVEVADTTFTTFYVFSGIVNNPPVGTTVVNFTIPAGVTQIAVGFSYQAGNPAPPTNGALDIQFDFGS